MHTARLFATSALALGIELTGLAPLAQPPANPPHPIPPNPAPQPANIPNPVPSQPSPIPAPSVPQRTPPLPGSTARNPSTGRFVRPFALQSPQMEARLNATSQRLTQMEQRLDQSNQDLMRRLGQVRQLSGDRQNAAMMDLVQQMLQNNADMQRYLVEARMGWLGLPDEAATDSTTDEQPQTAVPDTNPPR